MNLTRRVSRVLFIHLTFIHISSRRLQLILENFFCSFSDVATEKSQKNLFNTIEGFDSTKLKHAETQEKNPLPDKDG